MSSISSMNSCTRLWQRGSTGSAGSGDGLHEMGEERGVGVRIEKEGGRQSV